VTKEAENPQERFDDVVRHFIDFINQQVGAYMDAMAGFAGHHASVGRQVHRISRATGIKPDGTVVYASFEDASQPDFVLNRIVRADDYLAANAPGGSNEQQLARATVVFVFTYWEDVIRPRLAAASGVSLGEIRSATMGDLRRLRHVILHKRSVLPASEHSKLEILRDLFEPDQELRILYEDMHQLFVVLKQEGARLMLDWLGDETVDASDLKDVAIQNHRKPRG